MKRVTKIPKPKSKIMNFDWLLTLAVVACCIWGIFIVYAATANGKFGSPMSYVKTQAVAFILGMVAYAAVALIDYEHYRKLVKYIYIAGAALLVLVLLIGTGDSIGSKSWINIGGFGFQPAEVVKIGFIITFAAHLSKVKDAVNSPKNVFFLLLHAGVLIGLIMCQPDAGTALCFIVIFVFMIFTAGLSYKYIAAAAGLGVISVPLLWLFVLKDYQKDRILTFLNPDRDPLNAGYHAIQSRIAVGSGEITGKGLLNGTQVQEGILPTPHTDFIFSTAAEAFGFIGSILILALLVFIICRCITTSIRARDDFGSFICIGVAAMFSYHVFENIGMCIGLLPITGVPLLFFSAGGSSMLTSLIAIALVVAVRRQPQMLNDINRTRDKTSA